MGYHDINIKKTSVFFKIIGGHEFFIGEFKSKFPIEYNELIGEKGIEPFILGGAKLG